MKTFFLGVFGVGIFFCLLSLGSCNTRHHAKIYKLKNHHIVMRDDQGRWFEYVLNNVDIDFDVPTSSGRIQLPAGGSWRSATQQEEEEVTEANEVTTEDVSVSETDSGAVDSDGVDSGDSGGDSGGDGGGDGGDGD